MIVLWFIVLTGSAAAVIYFGKQIYRDWRDIRRGQ